MIIDIQKSKRIRNIKFILGGILVGFSVYRCINIGNASPFWSTYPGIAVLAIGIVNILKGVFSKSDSKITRTIDAGIGVTAIVVGLMVEASISDTSSKMIWFISLFLAIQGVGFIATGITQRVKSKATRIPKIIVGTGIIVALTGWFFEYNDLPIPMITILLSINLFTIGMEILVGAINHKITKG